ncbi:MAG TPA: alpha/beta hydrolase [Candidatus Xenobia bacterium]|jgi:pimeloyl-ACP methyl ester carboxylesterase
MREERVKVDGCELAVMVAGDGPAVVMLHGAGSTGMAWTPTIGVLSPHYTCIVPDLPACGQSSLPGEFWSVVRYGHAMVDLLHHFGFSAAHWVGNSFGAMVAAEVAAAHPSAVQRLALVAPPPVDEALAAATILALLRFVGDDGRAAFRSVEHLRLISPQASEALMQLANANLAACRWFYETLAAVAGYPYRQRLPRVKAATWLAWGGQDGLTPPSASEGWRRLLAAPVEENVFPEAGHCPQFDVPLAFNPRLRAFLAGGSGTS